MSEIAFYTLKSFDGRYTDAKYNRLVDLIQRITLNNGLNYRIKRTPAGTTLVTTGSDSVTDSCPFDVSTAKATDGSGDIIVSVKAGTVNQLLPSNNFSTFTVDPTTLIQVKAHVLTDGQKVTSSTLVVDTTAPAEQTPTPFGLPTAVDVLIAVIVSGVVYRVIGCGSIQLTGTKEFITSPSTPAAPGTPNFVPYYAWTVGVV